MWPSFGEAGKAQSPLAAAQALALLLSSLQSSTPGNIQGLQLNARVCTQCLPAEVLVTCLVKIPGLCILAAFSSCFHGIEYGGAAA